MRVLVTGVYDPGYNRNRVVVSGLRKLGVEVKEFPYVSKGKVDRSELKALGEWADVVYLPPFTHFDVRFIKRLIKKPLVFDPLISKYMTKVYDYKKVWKYSPRGFKNYFKDKLALIKADFILCDTHQHLEYFHQTFNVPRHRLGVVPVGVVEEDFSLEPKTKEDGIFRVGFYGSFNPLQGVRKIVETANLFQIDKTVHFDVIGDGPLFKEIHELATNRFGLTNITFHGLVPYDELAKKMAPFDVCLGIFGDSKKADIVVPNKVYHYASLKKPIITKDTVGIKEVFTNEKDVFLVNNTPEAIREGILKLRENPALRASLADQAYNTIHTGYNEVAIAQKFLDVIKPVLK